MKPPLTSRVGTGRRWSATSKRAICLQAFFRMLLMRLVFQARLVDVTRATDERA